MPSEPVAPEHKSDDPSARTEVRESSGEGAIGSAEHPSGLTIIPSKIAPEAPGRAVMTRPRLAGWFALRPRARLLLVSAEAGYGKSTLLAEHAAQIGARCVWYRIESSDGDWITFLSYMVAALRGIDPGFGRSTEALLRHVAAMGSTREVVVAQFLADLGSLEGERFDVILDDYHFVSESEDVRMIMGRMLERAPDGMRFILGGRGRPNLAVARLVAQGRVGELTIDDLRFTSDEIRDLFAATYQQPLDEKACEVVARRTEGWAASLQLVSASIATSQPSEVAEFIEALSGARGPIYDFLAEEVLTRLSGATQRVLIHASLLDRVRSDLVEAALSVTAEPATGEAVAAALDDAQELGLLSDRDSASGGRVHPLFRQFLGHHLEISASVEEIQAMHLAVAAIAEDSDWLVAAKHYALGVSHEDSMRVLGSAASEALGTGAWGAAVEIIELMPETTPPPSVEVIKARALVSDGRAMDALAILAGLDSPDLTPVELGLVALTKAAAHHVEGHGAETSREVRHIAANEELPPVLLGVARTWRQMLDANGGGRISDLVEMLRRLADEQVAAGLHYFAGVSLHNAANAELARGNYDEAIRLAKRAITELAQTDAGTSILASTQSVVGASLAELGDFDKGIAVAEAAATGPEATADAVAEAAFMHAISGTTSKARLLLSKLDRGDIRWERELPSRAQAAYARIAVHMSEGDLVAAGVAFSSLQAIEAPDVDSQSRKAVIEATLAIANHDKNASNLARQARETCEGQHAWRWATRARILEASAGGESGSLLRSFDEATSESELAPRELADVLASRAAALDPLPSGVERSILNAPQRWLPALVRQLHDSDDVVDAAAAAVLVARFGSIQDAEVLAAYDAQTNPKSRRRGLSAQLIRRVSPTVRVHDLGPTYYDIGTRQVALTETRRKAGALLLFLVTRSGLASPREQTMEALWPDQSPKSALNSLHQTLFFLRRDIESWYSEGATADYVRMESDMVFLDRDLFQVDSVSFHRQATDILSSESAAERGPEMLRLYRGSFAPEFEYEEWAQDWRTQLQGVYLHLARETAGALVEKNRPHAAVEVLTPVTTVEPLAVDMRSMLIACLALVGSTDAARAHYRSLAHICSRELGEPAPPYAEIIGMVGSHDR